MPSLPIDASLRDSLYRRADAARWQLPLDRFAQALEVSAAKAFAGRTPSARDLERYLSALRLEELALACACAAGIAAAWDHFVLEYRPILYRAAEAAEPGGNGREIADSLYADLFGLRDNNDKDGERGSLFRYYHGRSSLATWLRAVMAQRRVDRIRAERRHVPMPEQEPPAPGPSPDDPDATRLLPVIQAAVARAVAGLEARDRLRLRYYYAQELTLAQTGKLLREHEATVSRQLARTRRVVREEVERQLADAGLNGGEIQRCFECAAEDAGSFDLDRVLDDQADAARNDPRIVLSKRVTR
jgi:RNA polymerase sigma-70 factor (ECF subfamily)